MDPLIELKKKILQKEECWTGNPVGPEEEGELSGWYSEYTGLHRLSRIGPDIGAQNADMQR